MIKLIAINLMLFGSAWAHAADQDAFLAVGKATLMPYGWEDFCSHQPQECNAKILAPQNITFDIPNLVTLDNVNRNVNTEIIPTSNVDHWGVTLDHWDYPTPKDMRGDCKIYALWKRKKLMDLGFPRQALLILIVKDLDGNGHTILDVKTDKGDYILDNMNDDIKRWDTTGYKYIKRQSQFDPNLWFVVRNSPNTHQK